MVNPHLSPVLASNFHRAACVLIAILLTSCGLSDDAKSTAASQSRERFGFAEESWLNPLTWRNDEKVDRLIQQADKTREQMVLAAAAPLFTMAITAVLLAIFGPTWAERARHWFARRFALPPDRQRSLAKGGFIAFVGLSIVLASTCRYPKEALQPIAILCSGAAIIFFRRLLPLVGTPETAKAKLAFAQLKPLIFLVIVILVAMWMLSALRIL